MSVFPPCGSRTGGGVGAQGNGSGSRNTSCVSRPAAGGGTSVAGVSGEDVTVVVPGVPPGTHVPTDVDACTSGNKSKGKELVQCFPPCYPREDQHSDMDDDTLELQAGIRASLVDRFRCDNMEVDEETCGCRADNFSGVCQETVDALAGSGTANFSADCLDGGAAGSRSATPPSGRRGQFPYDQPTSSVEQEECKVHLNKRQPRWPFLYNLSSSTDESEADALTHTGATVCR